MEIKRIKRKVNFDVCTFCNHKCTFCSNPDERTIKAQVNLNDFKNVMDNIVKYVDVYELGLSAKGEVLINKDLIEIIAEAKNQYKIKYVYITTNGSLLNKQKLLELFEAGLDSIKISINGIDRESYKDIHLFDDFDVVVENVKEILRFKKSTYPKLSVMLSAVTEIDEDILQNAFKDIFKENYDLINKVMRYKLMYTSKHLSENLDQEVTKKCAYPFNEIYVNADLNLVLCCNDYFGEFNFGSLIDNDFLTLYNSKEFEEIRNMHIKNNFPDDHFCKKCLLFG